MMNNGNYLKYLQSINKYSYTININQVNYIIS